MRKRILTAFLVVAVMLSGLSERAAAQFIGAGAFEGSDNRYLKTASDSSIVVKTARSDTERGTNLRTAYTAAKLLTPGGNALSATNRATVVLPPGAYYTGTTPFTLDTNYVDLVALAPSQGSAPNATMYEWTVTGGKAYPTGVYSTPNTYIYGTMKGTNGATWTIPENSVVVQSANDVHLKGFGILNNATWVSPNGVNGGDANAITYVATNEGYAGSAFCVTAANNQYSVYDTMWFWTVGPGIFNNPSQKWVRVSVCSSGVPLNGLWLNCISNGWGFRQEYDGANMEARMYDCIAGPFSFGGDYSENLTFTGVWSRCTATGHTESAYELNSGELSAPLPGIASFMGCRTFSGSIGEGALVEDCIGGDKNCVMKGTIAGTIRRCSFGYNSVCGQRSDSLRYGGRAEKSRIKSTALIEDVTAQGASVACGGIVDGTLRRVTVTNMPSGFDLSGKVENSRFQITTANRHGITPLDTSHIYNTDIITTGTGVSITDRVYPSLIKTRTSGGVYADILAGGNLLPTSKAVGDKLIIIVPGSPTTRPIYDTISIDVATAAAWSGGSSAKWQYSNGTSTWADLTVVSDTTQATTGPLEQDGVLTFTIPANWTYATWGGVGTYGYCISLVLTDTKLTTVPTMGNSDYGVSIATSGGRTVNVAHSRGNGGYGTGVTNILTTDTNVWDSDIN